MLVFVIICGLLAVAYGIFTSRSILSASAGNERMQTIAGAIQEGAKAYLNRQYTTIGVVGIVVAVILYLLLGWQVAAGYLVGAILSGAAGYIGMYISVRANVRTTEAARQGLAQGLAISFKSGAVTGMLVAGLALLAVSVYYAFLLNQGASGRALIDPLVALVRVARRAGAEARAQPTCAPGADGRPSARDRRALHRPPPKGPSGPAAPPSRPPVAPLRLARFSGSGPPPRGARGPCGCPI